MASVYNRGSREKPAWYGRYVDADEVWRTVRVPEEHDTKRAALKWTEAQQEAVDAGRPDPRKARTFSDLSSEWAKNLTNRNATDDRARLKLHLLPRFGHMKVNTIDQSMILDWIDLQRSTPKTHGKGNLADSTVRHHFNLLSRFFSWCVPRHVSHNPVRDIPQGKRPEASAAPMGDMPWLQDDKTVRELYRALPEPYALMFYIGNRTGARLGEICGLRLSSFAHVDSGLVTLRWTYDDGFLKEDKKKKGKSKKAPVPSDLAELVKALVERRKAEGASPDSLVFPNGKNDGKAYRRLALERAWWKACVKVKFTRPDPEDAEQDPEKRRQLPRCTWYEATRHSFISRRLKESRGRDLYEIARAVGHRDTSMIAQHYDRWIIADFPEEMKQGIGLEVDQAGTVTPMKRTG